jgi:hypothetical protein
MTKDLIILNPEEASKLDYEANWKDLVDYEGYLYIKIQQCNYEGNAKGNETVRGEIGV